MKHDNTDTTSDGDDALGELKPIGKARMSRMSRMSLQRGPLGFLAAFHRSSLFSSVTGSMSSGSETRMTRFNDRPVCESPMLAAREYFVRSCHNESQRAFFELSFEPTARNISSKSVLTDRSRSSERSNGSKRFEQEAKNRIETTKELFERRMKRINPKFFEDNPIQKVPRFGPNELKLGDVLGKGEFGTVFAIESLERQPLPPLDYKKVIMESEAGAEHPKNTQETAPVAPVNAALTLPVATDLIVGKGNLDNFLRRRVEGFEEQPVSPAVMEEEIQPTNKSQQLLDSDIESERQHNDDTVHNGDTSAQLANLSNSISDDSDHVSRRRPGLAITDKKEQMINRQNNVESFDGYVVKVVRDDISNERKKCVAAADMAAEAKLLSALSHRNIISIRGIMGYIERPGKYGIIMDKLQSTLQDQIHEWAKVTSEDNVPKAAPQHRHRRHAPKWMMGQHEKEEQQKFFRQTAFFVERMEAVLDVAEAMKYLHEKRIIFRDLKPENVGLTKGNYVLFDFGLSRELTDSDRVGGAEDKYRATGLTGSRLFMAPEVAKKMPYGFSADVFSFSILFWEVVSLTDVFPTMTMNKHYKMVIVKGKRPQSLEDILPPELNEMMEASWDKDPKIRPTFESICQILIDVLKKQGSKSSGTNKHSSWLNLSSLAGDMSASSGFIVSSAFGKVQDTVTKLTPKIPSMRKGV